MEKQLTVTIVVFLFCVLYTAAIAAQSKAQKTTDQSDTVLPVLEPRAIGKGSAAEVGGNGRVPGSLVESRALVQKLGFGKRVRIKLKNGSKTSGRITGLFDDRFVVTDSRGTASTIAFVEISGIIEQKEKLGIFHRPWVGIMFTAAAVGTVLVVTLAWLN